MWEPNYSNRHNPHGSTSGLLFEAPPRWRGELSHMHIYCIFSRRAGNAPKKYSQWNFNSIPHSPVASRRLGTGSDRIGSDPRIGGISYLVLGSQNAFVFAGIIKIYICLGSLHLGFLCFGQASSNAFTFASGRQSHKSISLS